MSKAFEIARLLVLQAASDDRIDRPRAYAWAKRIYPLNAGELERKFKDDSRYPRAESPKSSGYRQENSERGKKVSFYSLESQLHPSAVVAVSIDGTSSGYADLRHWTTASMRA